MFKNVYCLILLTVFFGEKNEGKTPRREKDKLYWQ